MKRLLQLLLAGAFLLSFSAQAARVILPKGGENWSIGSSVPLEWDASGDTVDIQLIRQGEDPVEDEIATGIDNTGHYLWAIPGDLASGAYRIEIVGNKSIESKKFNLVAWEGTASAEALVKDDRAQVTAPLAGVVFTESLGDVRLTWDDVIDWLGDKVRIELRKHSKSVRLSQSKAENSGQFTLPDKYRVTAAKQCATAPGCYFTVRSVRHQERRIASGYFTFGEAVVSPAYTVSVTTETPAHGKALEISWTDNSEAAGPVRVDLYKGDVYYQTIDRSIDSTLGEDNVHTWASIPHTVAPEEADYRIVLTKEGDATVTGKSEPFAIAGYGGGKLTVKTPQDTWVLAKGRTTKKIEWIRPGKIEVRVDLYKSGRRIKTITDQTTKKQLRWKVSRFLPTGNDYTLRVQELGKTSYDFSKSFCIQREGETCDESPAEHVVQASGQPAFDPADADRDGNVTQEERADWEDKVARLAETIRYRSDTIADVDGDGVVTKEEKVNLARKILAPGGCGDSTIELAGRCVPNDYCPGYDVLNNERSLKPGEEVSARGEERRCGKYLLQGTTDSDATLGRLLEEVNLLLRTYGRYQALYQTVAELRKPYTWENQADFNFESPWHAVSDYDGNCITEPYRQKLERVVSALSDEECAKRADEKKINKSPFASRPVGEACIELRERMREKSEMRLCNHWHLSKKVSDSSRDHCYGIADERVDCGKIDLFYGMINSVLEGLFGVERWSGKKGSIVLAAHALPIDLEVRPEFRETAGFWWPDQALITDPKVIEDLEERSPIQAAHAEFIRLMSAYKEALVSRKHRLERPFLKDESVENKAIILDPSRPEEMIGESEVDIGDVISAAEIHDLVKDLPKKLHKSVKKLVKADTLSCGIGTERRNGRCEVCAAGTFSADGAGCQSCQPWEIADSSRSCGSCAPGTRPNKGQTACEILVCDSKQRWNYFTQRCEDVRHKRKDRWVQMALLDGSDLGLAKEQREQKNKLKNLIGDYASQDDRSRDYIHVLGVVQLTKGYVGSTGATFNVEYEKATVSRSKTAQDSSGKLAVVTVKQKPIDVDVTEYGYPSNDQVLAEIVRRGVEAAGEENAVFAININGHGIGDKAGGVNVQDLGEIILTEMKGKPIDLVTFDSCRMGSYEMLKNLEGRANWVIAHTTNTPLAGWDPENIGLAILEEDIRKKKNKLVSAGKGMSLSERVGAMVEVIRSGHPMDEYTRFDSVVAYRMDRFPAFRAAFDALLLELTARIHADPQKVLEKLKVIRGKDENRVQTADDKDSPNHPTEWYHVGAFLEELKIQFDPDEKISRLVKESENKLKALTRKTPDNTQARMMFGWSPLDVDDLYSVSGKPALTPLEGFKRAIAWANNR